jgi:PAS domain S-box-containing protein
LILAIGQNSQGVTSSSGAQEVDDQKHFFSEERYRVLVEQAADALFVHDFNGNFVEVNQRACELLGYTLDELLRMNVIDVEQDFNLAAAQNEWSKIRPGQPFILFGHQRRKDGSTFPVEVHFACLDMQGQRLFMGLAHDITKQRQAEEKLRASEEQFRTLIDHAPLAITFSRDSKFLYANSEYLAIHGIASAQDLIGRPIYERVAPQSMDESKKRAYLRAQGLPVEKRYELLGLRLDGTCVPLLGAVTQVNLVDGPATVGFFQDISERKLVEREIRDSEERYRKLFDNMLEGFASCKMLYENDRAVDFIYLDVNDAFERLTGLRNVVGKKVSEVIPGIQASNPELIETYGRVAQTGEPERFETFVEPLGIWFSISVYSTEKDRFIAVFDNITERKQVEEEIRKLNAELEIRVQERTAELSDLYNNAPCGYHSLDNEGLIVWINDTELRWLGYTREEIVGKRLISDFFTPASKEIFKQNFPFFKERGRVDNLEFEIVRKDGSILPILLSGTAVKDEQGRFLFSRSTMIDYTHHKLAEKEVREAQARLEAANRELEAFAYSVSHDLRAPLRAIDGFSGIIVEDYAGKLDEEANRLLNIIRANTHKMDQLISDLLSFSRLSRIDLRLSRIDMTTLVHSVYSEIAAPEVLEKFSFSVAPLPEAYGDPSLIQQVWVNLLSNAIKYTLPRDERQIEISARQENGMNIYSVRDSGVGFNPEYTNKLFGVFQRLHKVEEFDGTGVGLAIVQRIIHRHKGLVWAEGKINQGAVFYFSLPQREPAHELFS